LLWIIKAPFSRSVLEISLNNLSLLNLRIKREARKLGFFQAGIASVDSAPHYDFFLKWLGDGFHGEMSYLFHQAPKRKDPRLAFSEASSILVLAMNYFPGEKFYDSPLKGRISRYSWGEDYHGVIHERLEELLHFIQKEEPSAKGSCYVDTGPIMEKAWGARTVLGWMGKHTNLISRQRGSWFFLGVILLNIPLEPDSQEGNYCGTCNRCIEACPTGAIVAPYILDARICVSYLTIEYRGSIPRHLRHLIGNRIFGCDECQEICPWNRFARETSEKSFSPGEGYEMPDLIPLVGITPGEFKQRFNKSPIYRATRDAFVRNVVIALGNSGKQQAIPVLEEALLDSSALVRASAAWSLGAISQDLAGEILLKAQKRENNPLVLEEIGFVLSSESVKRVPGGGSASSA
jgi:epoxyqueuosine reductase